MNAEIFELIWDTLFTQHQTLVNDSTQGCVLLCVKVNLSLNSALISDFEFLAGRVQLRMGMSSVLQVFFVLDKF